MEVDFGRPRARWIWVEHRCASDCAETWAVALGEANARDEAVLLWNRCMAVYDCGFCRGRSDDGGWRNEKRRWDRI